jgi:hypothetical protein
MSDQTAAQTRCPPEVLKRFTAAALGAASPGLEPLPDGADAGR